ncbi:hypothetical protein, partial [Escherichia coli]
AFIGSPTPDATQTFAAQQAMRSLCDFFSQALARADELPEACLLRGLLQAHASGQLNRTELLAQCSTLLFAGYETTRNLLGNGVLA